MLIGILLAASMAAPTWLGPPVGDQAPKRVVSLAPSITEVICALESCGALVGVTRFDDFPESVRSLPRIGGFVTPSVEAVMALHPDLVVAVPTHGGSSAVQTLARLGVAVVLLPDDSLDDLYATFAELGRVLHQPQSAAKEVARLRQALAPAAKNTSPQVTAVLVVGHKPVVVAGHGTFLQSLLDLAGGRSLVTSGPAYPVLDLEALARLDPDVIVDMTTPQEGDAHAFWRGAAFLRAVKTGHVVFVPDPTLLRPGPRLDVGLARLRAAVHASSAAP